jgi:hypothetical protein
VLRSEDGICLAEGETVHFTLDDQGNKRTFPAKYLAILRSAVGTKSVLA